MPFISTAQYPAIRAALDVTLTAAKLPDQIIAGAIYHPAAEAEVTRRLGDLAEAADGSDGAARAVILFTAARLAPALPNLLRRTLGDVTLQYGKTDIAQQVAALRDEALVEIAALRGELGAPVTSVVPPLFTVAPGGRAQGTLSTADGTHIGGMSA